MIIKSLNIKEFLFFIFFVLFFSISCHFLFSIYGFVPSDDGFNLAYSRRILDGQVPYRDFLSAHNIGTPLLFVPFVQFGGDYIFWITRFVVWFEFASIAWIWTYLVFKNFLPHKTSIAFRFGIASIAFFFTAHSFPPMVWNTIDGLFIYSIGLVLCLNKSVNIKMLGYFLIGFTFLIKQNFIFLLPTTVLILGDWKSVRVWLAVFSPSIFFYTYFIFLGVIGNVIAQTTSRTEFLDTAIKGFTNKFTVPWGIIFGFSGTYFLAKKDSFKKITGAIIICVPLFYNFIYFHNAGKFIFDASFFLFGSLCGIALYFLKAEKLSKNTRILLLGVIVGWCVGISGGYNSPVFASGISFVFLVVLLNYFIISDSRLKRTIKPFIILLILLLISFTIYNFYFLRINSIYGEPRSATELTYKADSILPGGKNILVSKEIYDQLSDLQLAIKIAQDRNLQYAILPHAPGLWVKSQQKNPLPIDFGFMFNNQKALTEPFLTDIKKKRGSIIIIIPKPSLAVNRDFSKYGVFGVALEVPIYYKQVYQTKYHVLFE